MEWFTAGNGAFIRIGLYLLIFWPTVGYYVYTDSKKRDLSSPQNSGDRIWVLGNNRTINLYIPEDEH